MKLSRFCLLLLVSFAPPLAHANMTVATYQELIHRNEGSKQLVQLYVGGLASGFVYANTALQHNGQKPLFCRDASIDIEEANNILNTAVAAYMRRTNADPEMLVEVLLLVYLQRRYPCK
jgi:hypothetical protein